MKPIEIHEDGRPIFHGRQFDGPAHCANFIEKHVGPCGALKFGCWLEYDGTRMKVAPEDAPAFARGLLFAAISGQD